jgi:hypothetical protein
VARMSQVLRQGSNASDAVLFVHHILRVLSRGGHLARYDEMGQKPLDLGRRHLRRPLPVEQNEPSDPIDVGLLGADAEMHPPDDVVDLID